MFFPPADQFICPDIPDIREYWGGRGGGWGNGRGQRGGGEGEAHSNRISQPSHYHDRLNYGLDDNPSFNIRNTAKNSKEIRENDRFNPSFHQA